MIPLSFRHRNMGVEEGVSLPQPSKPSKPSMRDNSDLEVSSHPAHTSSFPPFLHLLPLRCPPLTPYPPGLSLPSMLDWNQKPSSGTVTTQQGCIPVPKILVKMLRIGDQPSRAFRGSQRREPQTLTRSHGPLSHPLTAPPWQASRPGLGANVSSPPLSRPLSAAGETQTPCIDITTHSDSQLSLTSQRGQQPSGLSSSSSHCSAPRAPS